MYVYFASDRPWIKHRLYPKQTIDNSDPDKYCTTRVCQRVPSPVIGSSFGAVVVRLGPCCSDRSLVNIPPCPFPCSVLLLHPRVTIVRRRRRPQLFLSRSVCQTIPGIESRLRWRVRRAKVCFSHPLISPLQNSPNTSYHDNSP